MQYFTNHIIDHHLLMLLSRVRKERENTKKECFKKDGMVHHGKVAVMYYVMVPTRTVSPYASF